GTSPSRCKSRVVLWYYRCTGFCWVSLGGVSFERISWVLQVATGFPSQRCRRTLTSVFYDRAEGGNSWNSRSYKRRKAHGETCRGDGFGVFMCMRDVRKRSGACASTDS